MTAPRITIEGGDLQKDGPLSEPGIRIEGGSNITIKHNRITGNTWPKTTLQWVLQHPAIRRRSRVVCFRIKRGIWW